MTGIVFKLLMFLGGTALLVFSVEKFVGNLTKTASIYGVSTFLLAVLFAGMDFENWGFGISAVLKGVPDIALGSAIGSAMFLMGAAVVIGGLATPFDSRIPRDYLVLMLSSPLILFGFLAFDDFLTRVDGLALLAIFILILFYIARRETSGERAHLRDEEVEEASEELEERGRRDWVYPALMFLFLAGIVVGSEFSVRGAKGLVGGLGLSGTVFGMTVVGLVMSLEEVLLIVEPVRKGEVNVATGNIVGSLIFFSLGNVGLLAAVEGFAVAGPVLSFYWPFLFASVLLVGIFLLRGRIGRVEALVLGGVYLAYWILSYVWV